MSNLVTLYVIVSTAWRRHLQFQYIIFRLVADILVPLDSYKTKFTLKNENRSVDDGDLELVGILEVGPAGVEDACLLVGQIFAI